MRISTTTLSRLCGLALGIAFAAIPLLASKQPSPTPTPDPVPVRIFTAKRVFISNAGVDNESYNRFYAAIKQWGKYELVSDPSDADLVFEIDFISGYIGYPSGHFGLKILDSKTRFILWTFVENVDYTARISNQSKNFYRALANLVPDVMNLAAQPANAQ
ncbi:MAG: hypothetical protein ABSG25_02530 [Bryobacteraceae bacterium]